MESKNQIVTSKEEPAASVTEPIVIINQNLCKLMNKKNIKLFLSTCRRKFECKKFLFYNLHEKTNNYKIFNSGR